MKDFDIAKYLREHQLGSYGILNHYVDLKPLKEEDKTEVELNTEIPYAGPNNKLTGNGEGDAFDQAETVSEDYEDELNADIKKMIAHIKDGIGSIDGDYIEQTWEGLSDIPFGNVQKQVVQALYDADVVSEGYEDEVDPETGIPYMDDDITPTDRIEGLINQKDLRNIQVAIQNILDDLTDDGFGPEDVVEFISDKIRRAAVPYMNR